MAYSIGQIYNLLLNNGATTQEAGLLAAIGSRESGGDPNAIHNSIASLGIGKGEYSVGIFQYNFNAPAGTPNFNQANPLLSTRGGYTANGLLNDVNLQAQSALALLRSGGPGNWTVYLNDPQGILKQAAGVVGSVVNPPTSGGGSSGGSGGSSGGGGGSSSSGGSGSGSSFASDVVQGFMGEVSGPIVVGVGITLLILGLLLWQGRNIAQTTKVVVTKGVGTAAVGLVT